MNKQKENITYNNEKWNNQYTKYASIDDQGPLPI